jgi:hypothetical protein
MMLGLVRSYLMPLESFLEGKALLIRRLHSIHIVLLHNRRYLFYDEAVLVLVSVEVCEDSSSRGNPL